jgi:hypothetical protein
MVEQDEHLCKLRVDKNVWSNKMNTFAKLSPVEIARKHVW